MVAHYNSRQLAKQMNPCPWYSNHLALHGLMQVLDLCHGNPMCQMNEVHVDALERTLPINTHDLISYSPSSMTREPIWPSWSHIFMYMIEYHYISSHQKHVFFISYIKKHTKNIYNSKNKFELGFITYLPICRSRRNGHVQVSIPSQGQSSMAVIFLHHQRKKSPRQGLATRPLLVFA